MRCIFWCAVSVSMIACGSTSSSSESAAASLQQLEGTYSDPVPYSYGDAFGHRTFVFGGGRGVA